MLVAAFISHVPGQGSRMNAAGAEGRVKIDEGTCRMNVAGAKGEG
jgi:hypothetical protein